MRLIITLLLSFNLLAPAYAGYTAPKVVTSLNPLKLIADEIMTGVAESESLIPINSSPHHFQFKPSHIRKTMQADLLIWINNDFETGLKRLQKILPDNVARLQLLEDADDKHEQAVENKQHSDHHEIDGHIWLSAEKIIQIAGKITKKLADLDPDHANTYQQNFERLSLNLKHWEKTTQKILAHNNATPSYILDHEFLSHFEQSFGLKHLATLHHNSDSSSRLRSLASLHNTLTQAQLSEKPVKCLLVPQLPATTLAQQLQKQYHLKLMPVHILGLPEHKTIIQLLESISSTLENCQ